LPPGPDPVAVRARLVPARKRWPARLSAELGVRRRSWCEERCRAATSPLHARLAARVLDAGSSPG